MNGRIFAPLDPSISGENDISYLLARIIHESGLRPRNWEPACGTERSAASAKKMGVPPGNRPAVQWDWFRGVPERYVAGTDTRGRQEGRPYPWSQQVIHEISGLGELGDKTWLDLTCFT